MLAVDAPSSKSLSHRMLMGAALADGVSTVRRVLMSHDIQCTMGVLSAAGAQFTALAEENTTSFTVTGLGTKPLGANDPSSAEGISCDMHESGTSCRLLTAILSTCPGLFRVHGAPRLHERPMQDLTDALKSLGVEIQFLQNEGHAPFLIQGKENDNSRNIENSPRTLSINCDASSQYLSGLLLAAPRMSGGLCIELGGEKVVSWPYVSLTLQTLENFGITFSVEQKIAGVWGQVDWRSLHEATPKATRFCVSEGAYKTGDYQVEGDWSGASYLIAAGALGTQPINVRGLNPLSLQGDRAILSILRDMGGQATFENNESKGLLVSPSKLHGIEVDMGHCPDLVPTVAVMAAFAKGTTTIYNCEHLRIKESDRIAAPAAELRKAGVQVEELSDGLRITGLGDVPRFAPDTEFCTHNDHRIAMSLALLGLHGQKVNMDNTSVVQKSFPHFWDVWGKINA